MCAARPSEAPAFGWKSMLRDGWSVKFGSTGLPRGNSICVRTASRRTGRHFELENLKPTIVTIAIFKSYFAKTRGIPDRLGKG
jgi:hypothetical protein